MRLSAWCSGALARATTTSLALTPNSKWVLLKVVNEKSTRLQDFTANTAIKGGLNIANSLSVAMSGTTFDFSVNGQKVGTIHDSTFPQGEWGLEGSSDGDIVFTNYLAHQ
jgi:hypothetical protein